MTGIWDDFGNRWSTRDGGVIHIEIDGVQRPYTRAQAEHKVEQFGVLAERARKRGDTAEAEKWEAKAEATLERLTAP